MRTLETVIRAHAKVNLFLRIIARRTDGFHEIQTVMHPIALFDELYAEKRSSGFALECHSAEAPGGEENTVCRAWRALERFCPGRMGGCRIVLRKQIPTRAGLGGASADAAAALLALDRLFGLELSKEDLSRLAGAIGSDAPFFLGGGAAVAAGKGELVRPIRSALNAPLVLALSSRGVSTAEAYGRFLPDPSEQSLSSAPMEEAVAEGDLKRVSQHLFNAFERLIFPVRPDLARTKQALREAGASGALMTGSGATVFGLGVEEWQIRPADVFAGGSEGRLLWTAFHPRPCEWP